MLKLKNVNFYFSKYPISINNVYIDKLMIPNKVFCDEKDFKNFIGYKDYEEVKPLCVLLPKLVDIQKVIRKLNAYLL